ncbi:MAG: hypothetical protein FD120_2845, partial [Gammaproteobacteria bacterium]
MVLIEPSEYAASRGLITARTVGRVVDGKLPIQVVNITDQLDFEALDDASQSPALVNAVAVEPAILTSPTDPLRTESDVLRPSQSDAIGDLTAAAAVSAHSQPPLFTAADLRVQHALRRLPLDDSEFAPGKPAHQSFVTFVRDYIEIFAQDGNDYGRTSLLKHS